MTGSAEGEEPEEDGWIDEIDETAVMPTAYEPPLAVSVPEPDGMEVEVEAGIVCVKGKVKVHRGLHEATNYAIVCGLGLATAVVVSALLRVWHAAGWVAMVVILLAGLLILVLGIAQTSSRRVRD